MFRDKEGKTIKNCLIPLLCAFASPLWAEVGTVAQVQNGFIIRSGTTIAAEVGDEVEQGDILQTVPSGLIHVSMIDDTRFVVGPDTTISIDTALIGSDTTKFESLAVGVTAGVFRFLSGDSEKSAYEVNTPVSTMGIRGTIFDVVHLTETDMVVTDGEVEFCAVGTNICIIMEPTCSVGSTEQKVTKINNEQALDRFILLLDQNDILDGYKADTTSCGDRVRQQEEASLKTDTATGTTGATVGGALGALSGAAAAAFAAGGIGGGNQSRCNSPAGDCANNGFGTGDQDAPGGSEFNNNAENAGGN